MSSSDIYEQLRPLLRPATVAVIGASRSPEKIGYQVLKNLIDGGFPRDRVFPVNPNATEILGLKCYPSVKDVPAPVDLAVIVVPAKIVPVVLRDCAEKGVKAVAVISAGFKEVGNVEAELELVKIAKSAGMRLLGPNIVGVCDTVERVNASFCQGLPLRGEIAFITQSGALAIGLVGWTVLKKIGLSDLVSIGNKADVDEVDLMEFFAEDPHTKVITIYLEGTNDGRRFLEVARRVTRRKPVVVLKAGKTERTVAAIRSHTGSLAGSDVAYDAAFKQAGVLRASNFIELFNWAVALAKAPLPEGENVLIITNGGGAGVMATDAASECGLRLMDVPADLAERLRKYMPPFGSTLNPVDLTGMATREWYEGALRTALEDPRVHAVVVLYCHTAITSPEDVADGLISAYRASRARKPVVAAFIGGIECERAYQKLTEAGIPAYASPEEAVSALGAIYRYARYLRRPERTYPEVEVDYERAKAVISQALAEGRRALTPAEAADVAVAYGIPVPKKPIVTSEDEAVKAAEEVGYPVVLEVESPQIIHKTEVGGIKVGLKSPEEVRAAYREMLESVRRHAPEATIRGVIVRRMIPQGKEVIIGMHRDPVFGPLIMFGSGGVLVELIRDVSFRVAPVSVEEAQEMIEETKAYRLLKGFRGEPECDVEAVRDVILRVSKLALDFPEVTDVDVNPLFVYERGQGCMAVDVKVMLRPSSEAGGS